MHAKKSKENTQNERSGTTEREREGKDVKDRKKNEAEQLIRDKDR